LYKGILSLTYGGGMGLMNAEYNNTAKSSPREQKEG
jgi:hypothetical protein